MTRPKYTVLFDTGIPTEKGFDTDQALKEGLKTFYKQNKESEFAIDLTVYNSKDENISETQSIEEMVTEIREEVDKDERKF